MGVISYLVYGVFCLYDFYITIEIHRYRLLMIRVWATTFAFYKHSNLKPLQQDSVKPHTGILESGKSSGSMSRKFPLPFHGNWYIYLDLPDFYDERR